MFFPYVTCSVGPVGPVTLAPVAPVAPVGPVGPVTLAPVAPVAPVDTATYGEIIYFFDFRKSPWLSLQVNL